MSQDAYELIAQAARYFFAAVMLLIVLRAARITAVDSRRAARLRRLSPMTGLSGELVVLEGDGNARRGMRYPVIREGMIGTSRRADIRIRHASVRRRHAYFQLTEAGLKIRGHAGARLMNSDGELVRELTLGDGGDVGVGRIHLLLVLSEATASEEIRLVPRRARENIDDEALFGVDDFVELDDALTGEDFDEIRPLRSDAAEARLRRDEFRRMHRQMDGARPSVRPASREGIRRERPVMETDDLFDGIVRASGETGVHRREGLSEGIRRSPGVHRSTDSFDGIRRPSGSTSSDGIRRKEMVSGGIRRENSDDLFHTDDDLF